MILPVRAGASAVIATGNCAFAGFAKNKEPATVVKAKIANKIKMLVFLKDIN